MNMTLYILYIKVSIVLICSSLVSQEHINLYSARQEVLLKPLIEKFETKTNIKVNIIAAKANQLINRIIQEGEYTKADMLLTTDVGRLYIAKKKNIFQSVDTVKINKYIPKKFKDKDNYWFGLSIRSRFLVYNKIKVGKNELRGYINLADNKWNKRVLVRSSNNVYNQSLVSAMILNYGEEEVAKFLKKFKENFSRTPSGGDRDQIRAILGGEGDIALVNSYYFLKMKKLDKDKKLVNIEAHFPEDDIMKTHINISGIGIIKYSKNKDNAIKFLEYLIGDEAQKIYAEENFEYPIRKNIYLNDFMKKYRKFNEDSIEINKVGELNKKALLMMDIAGWK
jgi:iron(III) transport system substrate-binding protein